ncbi:hypothetical protein RvY_18023 [Ramazzottius varieornatus]|uniref:Uncharacterized protein n=1 Tax=Ramazzottius varieornatus TaxID=947166 RepID=A0A1D1W490_RAMVA|nr:hypothetical protein RvY_18023 [Ramazzottius varieornatus]
MLELDTLNMFVSPSAGQKRWLKEAMRKLGGSGESSGSGSSQDEATGGPRCRTRCRNHLPKKSPTPNSWTVDRPIARRKKGQKLKQISTCFFLQSFPFVLSNMRKV